MRRRAVPFCLALLGWGMAACAERSEPGGVVAEAGSDSALQDPSCADGDEVTSLPKGSCVAGASCAITLVHCPGEPSSKRPWFCECPAGAWDCTHSGALNIYVCDAGADAVSD